MYTLNRIDKDESWNVENYRWIKPDRLNSPNYNGPKVGDSLIINFEYSELFGPFYSHMTSNINEIIESRKGFTHFKTENGGEYKLEYRKL